MILLASTSNEETGLQYEAKASELLETIVSPVLFLFCVKSSTRVLYYLRIAPQFIV